jgi:endonuclease YncB( thermonuclease family)
VHGRGKPQEAIHGMKQNKPYAIIRFQGIDAPELHYQPVAKGTADFRQVLGETCTVELAKSIRLDPGVHTIPCSVVTAVDHPSDVFDTYGRLIGDILIQQNGKTVNLNHWLVENGWAFPTFYDSMTNKEIAAYEALLNNAKQNASGVYGHLTGDVADIDWHLLFRPGGPVQKEPAGKSTLMPKIFRRLASWSVDKKNASTNASFIAYVKALPKNENQCLLTSDFKQGKRNLKIIDNFIQPNQGNGHFDKSPEDLVFVEAPSKLYDQAQGGTEITEW